MNIAGASADLDDGRAGWWRIGVIAAVFLVAILPVLSVPVLPVIDFYNHIARFFVLAKLDQIPFLAENYQARWIVLPNLGLDIVGTWAMRVFPPGLVAHGLTLFSMAVQFTGVLFFSNRLLGRTSLVTPFLLVPLLYSYIFVWGFANFLLGLGLVFWAAGWWLAWRHRLVVAVPVACLFALVIFLCHGVTFALYGLLVGGLELGFLIVERRPVQAIGKFAALAVQAIAPVALFLATPTVDAAGGVTNADEVTRRLIENGGLLQRLVELGVYRLQTIVRVAEGPNLAFDLATFVLTCGVLLALALKGRLRIPVVAWPPIAIGVILVVLMPPALFLVGYVADRMPLFLAFTLVGAFDVRLARERFDRWAAGLLVALAIIRIGYIGLDWRQYSTDFAEFRTVAAKIPPGSLVAHVNVTREVHVSAAPRCEMYGPLLVLDGQATPLFVIPTAQPLRIVGPLSEAGEGMPGMLGVSDAQAPAYFSDYIDAAARRGGYDYLLICGASRLTRPFPPGTTVAARTHRFTLLKLDAR